MEEYKATLEAYTQMVTQMKLNRGGDPTVLRLLKMKLERLIKTSQSESPPGAPAPPAASPPTPH
jgi:hypothetical protein